MLSCCLYLRNQHKKKERFLLFALSKVTMQQVGLFQLLELHEDVLRVSPIAMIMISVTPHHVRVLVVCLFS